MSEIDTGFDAVIAGEVFAPPPEITVTVNEEPPCEASSVPPAEPPSAAPTSNSAPTSTSMSPAAQNAAISLIGMPPLTWPDLAKLAREIAMNIREQHDILKEFKLSQTQYDFLEANNQFYREALANACREWHAPLNTQERIKVEAAAILEDSLLGLGARIQNKGEGLPGVVEAAKLFAKIAGVGERETGTAAPGERFTINIDLGGDRSLTVSSGSGAEPAGGVSADPALLPKAPGGSA